MNRRMPNNDAMIQNGRAGAASRRHVGGLTFVEVMVAVVIAFVLMVIGTPYVLGMFRTAGVTTQAHEFLSTLNFTRSEAIKRNQRVSVCKSADGLECTTAGGWEQGWIVFVDSGHAGQPADTANILRVRGPLRDKTTLTGNMPVRNYVSYVGTGATQMLSGAFQAGTLTLCQHGRGVKFVIARAGRVRTESTECS